MPTQEYRLSNGIPVVFEHQESGVCATYWWNQVGSMDERPKEAGFAHFLEHMLFKDASAKETGKASSGKMARLIEGMGGDINAYTSFDQTVYHVTAAAKHWESILDVFLGMAKPLKFLKADFEREREVILEELRKNEDAPGRMLYQGLFHDLFGNHPYGRPVIGFAKILKAAKVGELEAFYKRCYTPKKMGVILVGPVEGQEHRLLSILERKMGAKVIPPGKEPKEAPLTRLVHTQSKFNPGSRAVLFDVQSPQLALGFKAPDLKHPDIPKLDVLSGILSMGELSRLYQRLFYGSSLVADVSGGLFVPADPGLIYAHLDCLKVEGLLEAATQTFEEMRRIQQDGPTDEELERMVTHIESEKLYSTQTVDGVASRVGFMKFILNDLYYDRRYLEEIKAVNAEMIKDVAKRYLNSSGLAAITLLPKKGTDKTAGGKKSFDPKQILKKAQAILDGKELKVVASAKHSAHAAKIHPKFHLPYAEPVIQTLSSGLKVVFLERPSSNVFSIHAAAFGGTRLEHANEWGASNLMALTWTKGTGSLDSKAIARIVEGSAAGLDGFSGRNTVGLQATGLARDWKKLSDLFAEVLVTPTFPAHELEHSKRVSIDSLLSIPDQSSQLCSKQFLETLFEKHPYGKLSLGSQETITAMTSEGLRTMHERWVRPSSTVITIVGRVSRADADRFATELDARFRKAKRVGQAEEQAAAHIAPEPELKAARWVYHQVKREQVHIIIAGLGLTLKSPERAALNLLQTILGGQGGRLFIELREKLSLAYSVSPISFEGIEPGYFGIYIASAPQKRDQAIKEINRVMTEMALKGPTAKELADAKEHWAGRRAMDLQSDTSIAAHLGLEQVYGIAPADLLEPYKKVEHVTRQDVQDICKRLWVDSKLVTSVVG